MLRKKFVIRLLASTLCLGLIHDGASQTTSLPTRAPTNKTPEPNAKESKREYSSLRFTLSDEHGFPLEESKENFDCLDKIYAVTELSHLKSGKHAIEFKWVDPSGVAREHTNYDFYISDKPSIKLWAWLELSRAQGASMMQWLNPAAGLEEFIGQWELELLVDDKTIQQGKFEVSC